MNRVQLKERAKATIHSDYWHVIANYFLVSLLIGAATFLCSLIPVIGEIAYSILLGGPFMVGFAWFSMQYAKGAGGRPSDVFRAFQLNYPNVFITMFLTQLFVSLWALLLVIPGVIKFYEYRMVPYILAEDPDIDWKSAQRRSRELMDGHKMDTFVLDLSFIGWWILTALTCGLVGIFYVIPYYNQTYAELYLELQRTTPHVEPFSGSYSYTHSETSSGSSFTGGAAENASTADRNGEGTQGGGTSSYGSNDGHYTTL